MGNSVKQNFQLLSFTGDFFVSLGLLKALSLISNFAVTETILFDTFLVSFGISIVFCLKIFIKTTNKSQFSP